MTLQVTLWNEHAVTVRDYMGKNTGRVIFALRFRIIKEFNGKWYVQNAKFGGKVFLDLDIDEFNSYRQRFKINVWVIDSTGCATFILWDKDVKHLINRTTLELRRKQADMQKESSNNEDLYDYPIEIDAMLNKQCLFKLDISPNYNPNMSADIKVAKMTDDPDIITEFMAIYKQDIEMNVASQSGDNDHINEDQVTTVSSPVDKQKVRNQESSPRQCNPQIPEKGR
ncbi:OLC1v1036374C1 [Oldenlandia corymbosa var. corymbosa]|uniref:OLC1v1036374C1 n=1 Tax=Oldenlandia corymbosa var. corymbosa TaxID=529605 RepID=A0AAV1CXR2_OLDCO|nr:OLC1v1036374C1 [Oldenlandia corymbosa var. corymbosa]